MPHSNKTTKATEVTVSRDRMIAALANAGPAEIMRVLLEARAGMKFFHLSVKGIDKLLGIAMEKPGETR